VFGQVREKARQTTCISNLKEAATAILLYTQDYDETFPISAYLGWEGAGTPCSMTFYQEVEPYQRNADIMRCPSDQPPTDIATGFKNMGLPPLCNTQPMIRYLSYVPNAVVVELGYPNAFFSRLPTYGPNRVVRTMAAIPYPSQTSLLFDGNLVLPGGSARYMPLWSPIEPRHNGLAIANYVDGHTKDVKIVPMKDDTGAQAAGTRIDGKPVLDWKVTDPGPYFGMDTLRGIAIQTPDGDWQAEIP
jgi:prepilin-type processing-associated H-X9-DG protein